MGKPCLNTPVPLIIIARGNDEEIKEQIRCAVVIRYLKDSLRHQTNALNWGLRIFCFLYKKKLHMVQMGTAPTKTIYSS